MASTTCNSFHSLFALYYFVITLIVAKGFLLSRLLRQSDNFRNSCVFSFAIPTFSIRSCTESVNFIFWSQAKCMITTTDNLNNPVLFKGFNAFGYFLRLFITMAELSLIVLWCWWSPTVRITVLIKSDAVMFTAADISYHDSGKWWYQFGLVVVGAIDLYEWSILQQTECGVVVAGYHLNLYEEGQQFECCKRLRIWVLCKFTVKFRAGEEYFSVRA